MPLLTDPRIVVLLLGALEFALAIGLAALLRHYHRHDLRGFVELWAAAFVALAVYIATSLAAMTVATSLPEAPALRHALTFVAQLAAYLHLGWLLLGARALRAQAHAATVWHVPMLLAATAVALVATLAFAFDPAAAQQRIVVRVGVRELASALIYLVVSFALFGGAVHGHVGRRVVAGGLLALAGVSLLGFLATTLPTGSAWRVLGYWTSLLDIAALAAIGAGFALWMQQEERARTHRALSEIESLRYSDPVTGLANRNALVRDLADACRGGDRVVLALALRPDRLSQLRHGLGADAVETLLRRQAERLRRAASEFDALLGRIEDDRLLLAVRIRDDSDPAAEVVRRLFAAATPRGMIEDGYVTISGGYALAPLDARDPEALIAAAVAAQSGAEAAGGNRLAAYSADIGLRERDQLDLLADLRAALAGDRLSFAFQPVLRLSDDVFVYAEALLRWDHPTRGALGPRTLLPALESAGLMTELDRWAIRAACRTLARWRHARPNLALSVNVSAHGFQSEEFPELVAAALAEGRVAPGMLEIEITEQTAMEDPARAADTLRRLKRLGVRLALDDFGVGYSAMSQLKHLAVDRLKIDRSFIANATEDARDAAIANAIIGLGHDLGLEIVAEGVEQEGQLAFLRHAAVDFVQGYLVAVPAREHDLAPEVGALRAQSM